MDTTGDSLSNVSINLKEQSLSISGSEQFVNQLIPMLLEYIERNKIILKAEHNNEVLPEDVIKSTPVPEVQEVVKPDTLPTSNNDKYLATGIYSLDETTNNIFLHKKMPGSNKSEKTRNIALIVLYLKGRTDTKNIRALCEKQGCLDNSNFMKSFKDIETFIQKKDGSDILLDLTIDGREKAHKLLEDLANASAK